MNPVLRAFRPSDLPAIRALHERSASTPAVDRAAEQPEDAQGDEPLRRFVVEDGGALLGYAYVARSAWHPAGHVQGEVFVHPEDRRRGIGAVLARGALAWAADVGASSFTSWADGRFPEFERFALGHGFEVVQRFVTMTLTPADVGEALVEDFVAAARRAGVSLFTFEDARGAPEARQRLYELNRRLAPLLPGNGDDFPTFEAYAREVLDAAWFRPEGQLIAAVEDRWVGLVGLGFYEGGRRLHHEFTAVDPAHQGRGIALALKAWSVQKARSWGAQEVHTGNDATNAAIIGVNRRLGYRLEPGVVKLHRSIAART